MTGNKATAHMTAMVTIFIWGTTFVSTKILLVDFSPIEILFLRFVIGFAALFIACPKIIRNTGWRQELVFAAAGLCGICLYYLLENVALTYTSASNVGVIVSIAPFFTALLTYFTVKGEESLSIKFFAGFAAAMVGICMVSFGGSEFQLNPKGDLLAAAAAAVWACYSVLTIKIGEFGCNTIQATRRVFFYGILFMLPALVLFDFHFGFERFVNPVCVFNILFLGLGASATCFATWNFAVRVLGAVKTSVYIYMVPVVTIISSMIVLNERITKTTAIGALLTLAGLLISEGRFGRDK
ncbi:MAG: DMT family transporter [Firmicutes bacterium]|nr:DMT family transporter [Bacillota bacterium]